MRVLRGLVRALGLQVVAGLGVWAIVAAVALAVDDATLDLVTILLLFGQLVVVPLGLLFFIDPVVDDARFLFGFGGVAALVSLAIPRGPLSAAVAALYLVPALLVGASSAVRIVRGLRHDAILRAPELAQVAAGAFLAVGAVFFVLHRRDVAFAGLPELAVQLTAAHAHFTGFGLMLMAGMLAGRVPSWGTSVYLLLAGTVATPIGFLTDPVVEAVGAMTVVVALIAIVVGSFTVLGDADVRPAARRALFVSIAFSLVVGAMAALYAIGEAIGEPVIQIGVMARLHGTFAAIGVVFCGLLGWRLAND